MAQKRKISIRKVLQVALTLVVTVCCVVAMVSASKMDDKRMLKRIDIHIKNDKKYHFIEEQEIMSRAFDGNKDSIMEIPVGKQDLWTMERNIKGDPWVADAQVYIDNEKVLHIYVTQRLPIARFFDQAGASYYVDPTLHIMPLSATYKYYTAVVTNVPVIKGDSTGLSIMQQIAAMVKTIQADTFWSLQVSQIMYDTDNNFELLTLLGNQKIIFGDTSRRKEKLSSVLEFYKKVLNRIGWERYDCLDVRFKGQVVASPALPYSAPPDKDNLSWIKSLEMTGARAEQRDSIKQAELKDKHDAPKNRSEPIAVAKGGSDKQSADKNKKQTTDKKKPDNKNKDNKKK